MSLNDSVITGRCPGGVAYEAKISLLVGKIAALAAAGQATLDARANMASLDAVYSLDEALEQLRAALSPNAGEGWLPPEEVERLLRCYGRHLSWCDARNSMVPGAGKVRCGCGFRAALDALKEKRDA